MIRLSFTTLLTLLVGVAALFAQPQELFNPQLAPFYHGVASGDPLQDRVIIWTRVTTNAPTVQVEWTMATDAAFTDIVATGTEMTDASKDYTIKVDVTGLESNTTYYYIFKALNSYSLVGRTKTAPTADEAEHLRFALVSCSNWDQGYFNVYGRLADRNDLDAIFHVGDYIYEYEDDFYADPSLADRVHFPDREIVSVEDYRARFAQYRTDPDMIRVHQQHPFVATWDDHESTNDSYVDGAQNHQPDTEGDWNIRKQIARDVYFEWLPIRNNGQQKIFRKLNYGNLADVMVLDTRLEGRTVQPSSVLDPDFNDPRPLLGAEQKAWLLDNLSNSTATWKIIPQQIFFSPWNEAGMFAQDKTDPQAVLGAESFFLDIWDGYPAERAEIVNHIQSNSIDNVVILSGDIHCSFANDVTLEPVIYPLAEFNYLPQPSPTYNPATGEGSVAVEFICPSVTSANFEEAVGPDLTAFFEFLNNNPQEFPPSSGNFYNYNPHIKYNDLDQTGYLILDVKPERVQGNFYHATVNTRNTDEVFTTAYYSNSGDNHLTLATAESAPKENAAPLAPETRPVALEGEMGQAKFATFNVSLNRFNAGDLITELSDQNSTQGKVIAEIIQINQPDVLLLNEFDYDEFGEAIRLFRDNYLAVSQNGQEPAHYPYLYIAPSNTGTFYGFDLNNDGNISLPNDAYGFGFFEGQFAMALLSKYPIEEDKVRTFQNFKWKDMPGALLPDNPDTPAPNDWYTVEELAGFRLSSKSHWDVPINIGGKVVHVLASHPTPPVFDGPEDYNGTRNHDEIRFWKDYVNGATYIYDDRYQYGGLAAGESFVIMGDLNADPFDGDSRDAAATLLLDDILINTTVSPSSTGGTDATNRQGSNNLTHLGDPAFDTADFSEEEFGGPGNLRVDYALPSFNLKINKADVFWPEESDPQFALVGDFPFPSSDHRMVNVTVDFEKPEEATAKVQIIHNAATQTVDAYVNEDLALDNFAYRVATPFLDLPAGTPLNIGLALPNSTSASEAIFNAELTLEAGKNYVVVVYGSFNPADNAPIEVAVFDRGELRSLTSSTTDFLFFHGSSDAPAVDIGTSGAILFDNVSYGNFSAGYQTVPAAAYPVDVLPAGSSMPVETYNANLSFWKGNTSVIFATGKLSDGTFQPWVALSNGGTFPLFPAVSTLEAAQAAELQPAKVVGVSPNPTTGISTIRLDLPNAGDLRIDLVDLNGKFVRTIFNARQEKGFLSLDEDLNDLVNGVYFYRISFNGQQTTFKIMKL